jgi:hypothetical protein
VRAMTEGLEVAEDRAWKRRVEGGSMRQRTRWMKSSDEGVAVSGRECSGLERFRGFGGTWGVLSGSGLAHQTGPGSSVVASDTVAQAISLLAVCSVPLSAYTTPPSGSYLTTAL